MSTPIYGYLRPSCSIKAHEVSSASDTDLAAALSWAAHDWRDDPDWPCAAIGTMTINRVPPAELAAKQVKLLRHQKTSILATAQTAITEIDRQINSLLAITNEMQS